MSLKTSTLFLIGMLTLWISACTPIENHYADRSKVYVTSLQNIWTQLNTKALSWHYDAYLTEIFLPVIVDKPRTKEVPIDAYYLSKSDNQEMLELMMDLDGEIYTDIIHLTQPLPDQPIVSSDWQVDSVEALALMLNDEDIKFLLSHSDTQCSDLNLERRPDIPKKPVMWRLAIFDCGNSNYNHYEFIDPITGEISK